MELRDRVAVVTGGAVRIGRALCLALADAGADVCVHFGHSRDAAERTVADIRKRGRKAVTVQADLMQPAPAAETIISAAMQAFGRVDVLMNNASIFEPGLLQDTSPDDWDRHHRANLQAPLCLCQRFAEQVPQGGNAAIINMADWRALRPQPGHLAYTLSKAGIVCLTQVLAQELAPSIRVNAIAPGAILPPSGAGQQQFESLAPSIPLRRTGAPGDIVAAALYLLRNDFVTGEILHVTGGQQLQVPTPSS